MRKLILVLFVLFGTSQAWAQQDPVFSHYMFNPYYYVPALIAYDGLSSVTLISRNQWTGYEPSFDQQGGAPTTQFLNYSTSLNLGKLPLALGGTFVYDQFGPRKDTYVQFSLAYHLDRPRGRWSLGVRPTVFNKVLDYNKLVVVDPEDLINNPTGDESYVGVDLAGSIAYSTEFFLVGVGVDHLLQPDTNFGFESSDGDGDNLQDMLFSLFARYEYQFTQKLSLEPTVLLKSNLSGFSYDISARAIYQNKMWAGLAYRDMESMTLLLGYSFLQDNSLSVGYSFDYILVEQEAKQATSHELFVRYNLPGLNDRSKKIVRTPRFRF
ncbi:PorP/SprF family type IX secretion system membrane protein [Reichenbachiella ulvae]|uniref:PorP/SprF family type IX secretion system membrane protein n=1 Tax=Reichenbachiella ulvae TaxID=2980104 RepID=A0ABT3CYU7_9BACT|nr:PorP/SprF family type IX secretion system membrane protein [Reichenbachiella ulvae]MCV9388665.1 PorP/SprF family type IX secretion system membrane protein [Reichenbachiella ulvae]